MLSAISPQPFVCRSPLLPGESLYSLLTRLAALNRHTPPTIINLCFHAPSAKFNSQHLLDIPERPFKATTYDRLAIFTGLAPTDLYAATPHRYSRVVMPPYQSPLEISLTGHAPVALCTVRGANRELRGVNQAQFCPACLKEAAYHRLIWSMNAVSVCLQHQCLLVGRCPQCRQNISVRAVVQGHCLHCAADLTLAPTRSIRDDTFGRFAQRTLLAWLEGQAPRGEWATALPPHPAPLLFHFIRKVRHLLLRNLDSQALLNLPRRYSRSRVGDTLPEAQYELTQLAMRAIVKWPRNFIEFKRALRNATLFENSPLKQWVADYSTHLSTWWGPYWKNQGLAFVCEVHDPDAEAPGRRPTVNKTA